MKKKIDFLNRMFELLRNKVEILEYLKMEKLITDDQMQRFLNENHIQHASRLAFMLEDLLLDEKLQLADYEWTILPFEVLKLTLVSATSKKEFIYGA